MMQRPDIIGDTWFNSPSLDSEFLNNRLVLVNFWSYSCAKCSELLPHLRTWWRRYRNLGFMIVGIHTPEFDFERDAVNVENAIEELGIEWPVVLDNDYVNWENFGNQYWPANHLFNRDGALFHQQFGEGTYGEIEMVIQQAIKEQYGDISFPDIDPDDHAHGDACFVPTRDLHCGYARGRLDNSEGFHLDIPFRYRTSSNLRKNSFALLGSFVSKPEYVESAGDGATVLLQFRATEVNLVLKPVDAEIRVKVTFNGKLLAEDIRGRDVNSSGELVVEKPALYNLVSSPVGIDGVLAVTAKQGNYQAFVFTFSGCSESVAVIQ